MKNLLNKKQFIINKDGDKVGVVLDMDTYSKIEKFYEDFVLGKKMDKAKKSKSYSLKEAAKKVGYAA
jgi:hypothetical protein